MASISHEAANMKAVGERSLLVCIWGSSMSDIKNGTGSADDLFIAETPKPKPEGAQAIVKIKAFGLNRMDLLQREGQYPVPPQAPKTLGVDFSGTIDQVAAEGETTFKAGDEVIGLAYGGKSTISSVTALSKQLRRGVRRVHCRVDTYAYPQARGHVLGGSRSHPRGIVRHRQAGDADTHLLIDMDHRHASHVSCGGVRRW